MGKVVIKCYRTLDGYYFYDRHMDSICKVNPEEYELLSRIEKTGVFEDNARLSTFRQQGLLQESKVKRIEHPDAVSLEILMEDHISSLVLQVTQECNFRCKYCVYSGNYYTRCHSSKNMSWEVAKQSLDFYIKHSGKENHLSIGFYGGEPLLRLELIKKVVKYVYAITDKKISFHMTTNGYLLTADTVEFLIKNNFNVMISLDGDQITHDSSRVLHNGTGSFSTVWRNICYIFENYYQYYKRNISFNCVLNRNTRMRETFKMFTESGYFDPEQVHLSYVDVTEIKNDFLVHFHNENEMFLRFEYVKLLLSVLGRCKPTKRTRMMHSLFAAHEVMLYQLRKHSIEQESMHHPGPCIPGIRKLFVTVDGDFYPCERVSEEKNFLKIGSLRNGFDYDSMIFFLNHGQIIEDKCIGCWNLRHCLYCIGSVETEGRELSREYLLKKCLTAKERTIGMFQDISVLCELERF